MDGGYMVGDRYILEDATMSEIIAAAYGLDPANVQGGPSALDWDHFDIIAKASPSTSRETLQLMLQSLLAERFHLVVHKGAAPMPVVRTHVAERRDPAEGIKRQRRVWL